MLRCVAMENNTHRGWCRQDNNLAEPFTLENTVSQQQYQIVLSQNQGRGC